MDELVRQIQQSLDERYNKGFEDGWNAVWSSLEEFVRTGGGERLGAEEPAADTPSEDEPSETADVVETSTVVSSADRVEEALLASERFVRAERRLSPAEQRAVAYVTEHKGLQAKQIRGIGRGILYGLAKAGVLANINGRFYPADHA